jgi:glycosyltransferase involved in cell wall biosynthesis
METVDLNDAGVRFPLAYKVGGFVGTQLLLFSNSVSVMLPAYRNVLLEKYGRGAVYVRRHGIFTARPEYPDLSQRGNPEHRILAFGKWGTYKRLETLLEAFELVIEQCPEARLVIAGTDHPKTPGYLKSVQQKYRDRVEVSFIGYVAESDIGPLLQRSSVAVLPYTSSAGSSGIAHLACTYGVPIVASDIPDFRRLAEEESLAIDFFPPGDVHALAQHLIDLLGDRDRQEEMAMQNVSAAMRMSMPQIIRQYLRTFELRQDIEAMQSLATLRKLPRWFPMREHLARRKARRILLHNTAPDQATGSPRARGPAEVVYISSDRAPGKSARTGSQRASG